MKRGDGRNSHAEERELKIKTPADTAKIPNMPPSFTLDSLTNLGLPPSQYYTANRMSGLIQQIMTINPTIFVTLDSNWSMRPLTIQPM